LRQSPTADASVELLIDRTIFFPGREFLDSVGLLH